MPGVSVAAAGQSVFPLSFRRTYFFRHDLVPDRLPCREVLVILVDKAAIGELGTLHLTDDLPPVSLSISIYDVSRVLGRLVDLLVKGKSVSCKIFRRPSSVW